MKKQEIQEVNFIDLKKEKKKRKKEKKKKKEKKVEVKVDKKPELLEFENEIIVGVREIPEEHTERNNKKKKRKKEKRKKQNKQVKKTKQENKADKSKKETKISKKKKRIIFFIKSILIITILLGITIFIITSPLFNITEIKVENNNKISSMEIINLSEIQEGSNIFQMKSYLITKKIKQNPYIEDVKIIRDFPGTVRISVKERKAKYILQIGEGEYAYINNQGYILEKSSEILELPQITSFKTEDFTPGGRLCNDDLEKLEVVLRIMETANSNGIGKLITKIDIENGNDFKIRLESEKKTVYLGDASDINTKMLYIKANIEDEKGVEGELFMDGKTNKENEFLFREKV